MPPNAITYTGIELGTHSVKVIMCEPQPTGVMRLLGYEESTCLNRVVKGEVINAHAVAELLADCVNRLEAQTRRSLHTVILGCGGTHVCHRNDRASIPVTNPQRIIGEDEVVRVTREARSHALPPERQLLHTLDRFYMVDDQLRTHDPLNHSGSRLTADIHSIHADANRLQTNINLVSDVIGREPDEVVFNGLADFHGLELSHEARPGVLVLGLGAGVTTFVLFHGSGCHHSGVLGVGMEHVANDLSVGLGISMQRARELVRTSVSALRSLEATGRQVEVPTGIGREPLRFPLATVQEIAELRLREILEVVREDLERQEVLSHLGHGVILCGGGALIPRLNELAQGVFGAPVRTGFPVNVTGLEEKFYSPRLVTPVGLCRVGELMGQISEHTPLPIGAQLQEDMRNLWQRVREGVRL